MLLAVDIGNSNTIFGIFKQERLVERHRIPTDLLHSFSKCNAIVYNLSHGRKIQRIMVSSVVPDAVRELEKALKRVFRKDVLLLGRDIQPPIKNMYKHPGQVGHDRLVNATAASFLYNRDKKNYIIIIDFGTAVTFDVISDRDEYLGGIIFPGIKLSLENLWRRAALLPKVRIKKPASLVGRDTKDSMRSGILYGYAALCDGIVRRIIALYKRKIKIIATGGDATMIAKYTKSIKRIDTDLTLKGLKIICDEELKRSSGKTVLPR